jgi:hypothetical protein
MKSENFYLTSAILSLRPNSEFAITEDDYSTIEWHVLEGTAPTKAQVTAEITKIKAAEVKAEADYQASRAALLTRLGITEDEAKLLFS